MTEEILSMRPAWGLLAVAVPELKIAQEIILTDPLENYAKDIETINQTIDENFAEAKVEKNYFRVYGLLARAIITSVIRHRTSSFRPPKGVDWSYDRVVTACAVKLSQMTGHKFWMIEGKVSEEADDLIISDESFKAKDARQAYMRFLVKVREYRGRDAEVRPVLWMPNGRGGIIELANGKDGGPVGPVVIRSSRG